MVTHEEKMAKLEGRYKNKEISKATYNEIKTRLDADKSGGWTDTGTPVAAPPTPTRAPSGSSFTVPPALKNTKVLAAIAVVAILIIAAGAVAMGGGISLGGEPEDGAPTFNPDSYTYEKRSPNVDEGPISSSGNEGLTGPLGFITLTEGYGEATQTITITNDFAGVDFGVLLASTVTGNVQFAQGSDDAYSLVIELYADGNSPADAEENLKQITVQFEDVLYKQANGAPFAVEVDALVQIKDNVDYSQRGEITILVPPKGDYRVFMSTTTGSIMTSGLRLDSGEISTTTGSIMIDAPLFHISDFKLYTTTGDVMISAGALASGTANCIIEVTTGSILLEVPANGGYDIEAETTTGSIQIELPNLDILQDDDDHKHVKTKDYNSKSSRLHMLIETTTGNIQVGT